MTRSGTNRVCCGMIKIGVLKQMVNKETETIVLQVLDGIATANIDNHKWEYVVASNKMEELRNNTAKFSNAMKTNGSINQKVQAWCEGKVVMVTKTSSTNTLTISCDVDAMILAEYHQLVLDETYWRLVMLVFGCDNQG